MDRLNSAERGTFEWALAGRDEGDKDYDYKRHNVDPWSRPKTIDKAFTDWLMANDGDRDLFCFMGKPKSGKSTLMYGSSKNEAANGVSCTDFGESFRKYLSTNSKVEEFLEMWTMGKELICAEHFFWIVGDTVQKSREGLLRHLLYSALLSLPEDNLAFAKHVCGSRRLSNRNQRAWSYDGLYDMLVRLVSCPKARFVFMADALDECDPQDLHGRLADEMMKISQLPNVKLCVSCQPWSPFLSSI